jgi:hypothetical protein
MEFQTARMGAEYRRVATNVSLLLAMASRVGRSSASERPTRKYRASEFRTVEGGGVSACAALYLTSAATSAAAHRSAR